MEIPFFQVDAFTSRPFGGNPAAVCVLPERLPEPLLQTIAAENNLSETAFLLRRDDGEWDLRWFTPTVEVDLCGHATLASGVVLYARIEPGRTQFAFHTRSGRLEVSVEDGRFVLDLPARRPEPIEEPPELAYALGATPAAVLASRDLIAVFGSSDVVCDMSPHPAAIAALDAFAVGVTAPGTGNEDDVDFVSRFFAPSRGVPEDPVTGSLHCSLVPYWAERLGKTKLRARQVSKRGGELWCELAGDRVRIGGEAVLLIEGVMHV